MSESNTEVRVSRNQDQGGAEALWYVGPGRVDIRPETVAEPGPTEVRVRALHGALSRGTERLVFTGRVPEAEFERMRSPSMAGTFPFPVKYGYANVGRVEAGAPALLGKTVFSLFPHQSLFTVPADQVVPVPDQVPPRRAVLAANMETALNAVWDAAPGPADRIAIFGAGVVGLAVAHLCAGMPGTVVTVVDIEPSRATLAKRFGAAFTAPDAAPTDCDLVIHTSASTSGLATALRLAGEEATVLELSWYGAGEVGVALGGAFHSRRLRLISSQVGRVAPSHRARWTHYRRLEAALQLLADPVFDELLAPPVLFHDLPTKIEDLLAVKGPALCPLIDYPRASE